MSLERFMNNHYIPENATRAELRKFYATASKAFPLHVDRLIPYGDKLYTYLRKRTKRERYRQREAFLVVKKFFKTKISNKGYHN